MGVGDMGVGIWGWGYGGGDMGVGRLTCFESSMHEHAPKVRRPNVEGQLGQPRQFLHTQLHPCRAAHRGQGGRRQ